jgi:hypothetical protein
MAQDCPITFDPVIGEEILPATGKLLGMLLLFLSMMVAGATIAIYWSFEIEMFSWKVPSTKEGIIGLAAIPIAASLSLAIIAYLDSAKKLVIGADCLQLHSKGRVAVHIPYANVVETFAFENNLSADVVGFKLRQDAAMLVPGTKDGYEIQVGLFRTSLHQLHDLLNQRLMEYRTRAR